MSVESPVLRMLWRVALSLPVVGLAGGCGSARSGVADAPRAAVEAADAMGARETGSSSPDAHGGARPAPDAMPAGRSGASGNDGTTEATLPPSGLVLRGSAEAYWDQTGGGHLGEIALFGNAVYVADSFNTVGTFALRADGSVERTADPPGGPILVRCTTVAVHAPSSSLYCTAPLETGAVGSDSYPSVVWRFDVSSPEVPGPPDNALAVLGGQVLDLAVAGDTLWMASAKKGVLSAPIDPASGGLSNWQVALPGRVWSVVADAEHVAALAPPARLLVASIGADGKLGVPQEVSLPGPPLDVAIDGDLVGVAVGSAGAMVYRIADSGSLELVRGLQPRCVAASVDVSSPSAVAVGCLTLTVLYDLDRPGPFPAGVFQPTMTTMDVAFLPGHELLVLDWHYVHRLQVALDGEPVWPEWQRDAYISWGSDARVGVRNRWNHSIEVRLVDVSRGWATAPTEVGPGATAHVDIPWAAVEAHGGHLDLSPQVDGQKQPVVGTPWVRVVVRRQDEVPAYVRPAPGQSFAKLRLTGPSVTTATEVPAEGGATWLVFYTEDCVAMWPILRDLDWALSRGKSLPFQPIAVTTREGVPNDFTKMFDLASLQIVSTEGPWADIYDGQTWVPYGDTLYEQAYAIYALPGGAQHPTDYFIDSEGRVVHVTRYYRGLWPIDSATKPPAP